MKKILKGFMLTSVILGASTNVLASGFTDVKEGSWYEESVNYLTSDEMEVKVISGYTDGTFRPMETLTIEQFLVLVNRAIGNEFDTSDENVKWSEPYMDYAINNDWLSDVDYTDKAENISREVMAKILINAVEGVEDLQYRPSEEIESL